MKFGIKHRLVPIVDDLKSFVKKNLFFIILFAVIYLVGIVIGVSVAVKTEDAKASLMVVNWLIGSYAIKNMNLFLFFLIRVLLISAVLMIFALLSYKLWFSFVFFAMFIYLGMACGGAIVLLFAIFGASSIVIDLFGFVIFELVFAAYFILYASYMLSLAVENHRFGCNYSFRSLMFPLLQQFLFLAVLVTLQTIMLFLCSIFIL